MITLPKLLDVPGLNRAVQNILENIYSIEKAVFGTYKNGSVKSYENYNGIFMPYTLYDNTSGELEKIYAINKDISQIDDSDFKINLNENINDLQFQEIYKIRTYIKASDSTDTITPTSVICIDTYVNDIENYMCKIYRNNEYYIGTTHTFTISDSPELVLGQIIVSNMKLCFANLMTSNVELNNADRYIIKIEGWKKN